MSEETSLQRTERMNELIDFYAVLLTAKQNEILDLYYHEDLSLAEIAAQKTISRSAVSDLLRRCTKVLEKYEDKLHLVADYHRRHSLYQQLEEMEDPRITSVIAELLKTEHQEEENYE